MVFILAARRKCNLKARAILEIERSVFLAMNVAIGMLAFCPEFS